MLTTAFEYSLAIIFRYTCFQDGMILAAVRRHLDRVIKNEWVKKPLFNCVVCMCGLYSILFWVVNTNPISMDLLKVILLVGGINVLAGPLVETTIFDLLKRKTNDGK